MAIIDEARKMQTQSKTTATRAELPGGKLNTHHSAEDVSREQRAAVKFLAAVEAAGLQGDEDMLVPSLAAAGVIGVKQQTLAVWRSSRSQSLPYIKNGRRVHYRLGELRRFTAEREKHPVALSA